MMTYYAKNATKYKKENTSNTIIKLEKIKVGATRSFSAIAERLVRIFATIT